MKNLDQVTDTSKAGETNIPVLLGCLALIIITALVPFLPTFGLFFDHTDDFNFMYPLPLSEYPKLFIPHWNYYRPLPEMFWLLEFRIFDVNPLPYRITAWVVHLLVLLSVFTLCRAMSSSTAFATGVALILSQRPGLTDAVARLGGGIDTLLTLPYILSLVAYWYCRTRRSKALWAVSFAIVAISLLSKEMAVTLPIVIMLIELTFFMRSGGLYERIRTSLKRAWPFFAITVLHVFMFVFRPFWPGEKQVKIVAAAGPLSERILRNCWQILADIFQPLWLALPIIVIGLLPLLLRKSGDASWNQVRHLRRTFLFALGLLVIAPLPIVWLPLSPEPRILYLPSIPAAMIMMVSVSAIGAALSRVRKPLSVLAATLLILILVALHLDLRETIADFTRRNEIKGSFPMSIAHQVGPSDMRGSICLAFRPGQRIGNVGTEVINFWVRGAEFMLHDRTNVLWIHDFLLEKLWKKLPVPDPEYWVCQDLEARRDPSIGALVNELLKFRSHLEGGEPGVVPHETYSWDFNDDTLQGWVVKHGQCEVRDGMLELSSTDSVLILESSGFSCDPWYFSTLEVDARFDAAPGSILGTVYFRSEGDTGWPEWKQTIFEPEKDGRFHTNSVFLLLYYPWIQERNVSGIKLVINKLPSGAVIDSISLSPRVPPIGVFELMSIAPSDGLKKLE